MGVISNKPEAYALQRAENAGIATAVIEHKQYPHREAFDDVMHQQLLDWDVDLVVLAGFMRILSEKFVSALGRENDQHSPFSSTALQRYAYPSARPEYWRSTAWLYRALCDG